LGLIELSLKIKFIPIGGGPEERISNGGFQTGDFTDWSTTGSPIIMDDFCCVGEAPSWYCCLFTGIGDAVEQTLAIDTPVNDVIDFLFQVWGGDPAGQTLRCVVTYTDASSDTHDFTNLSLECQELDMKPYLTAGKTIDKVKFIWQAVTANGDFITIDGISLTV